MAFCLVHPQINQEIICQPSTPPPQKKKPQKKPTITSALISTSSSSPQQITDLTLVLLLVLIALLPTLLVIYMPLISLIYEYGRSTTTKFKLGGKHVKKLYIIMYPCICIISHGNKSTSTHKAHTYMKRQDRTLPTLLAGALTLTSSPRGKSQASFIFQKRDSGHQFCRCSNIKALVAAGNPSPWPDEILQNSHKSTPSGRSLTEGF